MQADIQDFEWLDLHRTVDLPELGHICGLSSAEVHELLEYGLVAGATAPRVPGA